MLTKTNLNKTYRRVGEQTQDDDEAKSMDEEIFQNNMKDRWQLGRQANKEAEQDSENQKHKTDEEHQHEGNKQDKLDY